MAGIGSIHLRKSILVNNSHLDKTSYFINHSQCIGVYISKFHLSKGSTLEHLANSGDLVMASEEEINDEYRMLIKRISTTIKGSYGNQFVVKSNNNSEIL